MGLGEQSGFELLSKPTPDYLVRRYQTASPSNSSRAAASNRPCVPMRCCLDGAAVTAALPRSAIQAANNFRTLRSLGITVRKTVDTLTATSCIEKGLALLYSDKDFDPFVEHLGLQSAISGT